VRTHFFDRVANLFAQAIDLAHREAEHHQQVSYFGLRFHVLRVPRPTWSGRVGLFCKPCDEIKLRQGSAFNCARLRQPWQRWRLRQLLRLLRLLFVVSSAAAAAGVGAGVRRRLHKPSISSSMRSSSFRLAPHIQDLLDGERHDEMAITMWRRPLRFAWQFRFHLHGEQVDGAHFAHVHANRVGGAAKIGIDSRNACSARRPRLRRQRRRGFLHQQGLGIRRFVVDLDAMSLIMLITPSIWSASSTSSGKWSLISA